MGGRKGDLVLSSHQAQYSSTSNSRLTAIVDWVERVQIPEHTSPHHSMIASYNFSPPWVVKPNNYLSVLSLMFLLLGSCRSVAFCHLVPGFSQMRCNRQAEPNLRPLERLRERIKQCGLEIHDAQITVYGSLLTVYGSRSSCSSTILRLRTTKGLSGL